MNYRARLIKWATFLGGIYYFLEYVLPQKFLGIELGKYNDQISDGFILIGVMAFGMGLINLFSLHGAKLVFRRKGWINSVALLAGLVAMMVVVSRDWGATEAIARQVEKVVVLKDFALQIKKDLDAATPGVPALDFRAGKLAEALRTMNGEVRDKLSKKTSLITSGEDAAANKNVIEELTAALTALTTVADQLTEALTKEPAAQAAAIVPLLPASAQKTGEIAVLWRDVLYREYRRSPIRSWYQIFFDGIFTSLGAAMFSLLGFYIATAAYRAFRIRSTESGLMLTAALLVMLGQIPFGILLWDQFPAIRLWLLNTPTTAALRAIQVGASVAGLIMAFRMWLSIESESFSKRAE